MIYVISDLHGYDFKKFRQLLRSVDFSEQDTLYILGDVVDRGADGIDYLQWAMEQPNVILLLGNHEKMMRTCDFLFDPNVADLMLNLPQDKQRYLGLWMYNGAEPTVEGLFSVSEQERLLIGAYLQTLPQYETLTVNGREFLLVHSGLRGFQPERPLDSYDVDDLVWERPSLETCYFEDKTTILGHTPTWLYGSKYEGKILDNGTWIDIDVGAGYGYPPVLLRLDDMAQFTVEKDA